MLNQYGESRTVFFSTVVLQETNVNIATPGGWALLTLSPEPTIPLTTYSKSSCSAADWSAAQRGGHTPAGLLPWLGRSE